MLLCVVKSSLSLHQKQQRQATCHPRKQFINNLKTYDYENDAIKPDDSCSYREHRDGNEFQECRQEVPQGHSEIPYRDQSCIPPLC